MSRARDLCSYPGPCALKGPALGFMLDSYPLNILSDFCPRGPAFLFCICVAIMQLVLGGRSDGEVGAARSGPLATPLPASSLSSPAPDFASRARIFKSGKRAREKFVMMNSFLPPSALFSLFLCFFFFFLTPLHCRFVSGVWQGTSGNVAEWLAGWEGVASTARPGQALGSDGRQCCRR